MNVERVEARVRDRGLRTGWLGRAAVVVIPVVLAGCDGSSGLDGLPEAAREYLNPTRSQMRDVAPGIVYRMIETAGQAWTTHLLEVDATRCEIGFQVVGLDPDAERRLTVSDLAEQGGSGVLAAVNGDFFTPENRAVGIEATGGELRGRLTRPVFAWRPGASPRLSSVTWEGDSLRIGDWWIVDGDPDGRTEVLAGFPSLLADGAWVGDLLQEERPAFAAARHPRTALGWDPRRERLWIVVADGRRDGLAEGMTLPELADLFEALGATEALNLDGGGSSTMVLRGRVVSRPSDPSGARQVVNALVVKEDPSLCRIPEGD